MFVLTWKRRRFLASERLRTGDIYERDRSIRTALVWNSNFVYAVDSGCYTIETAVEIGTYFIDPEQQLIMLPTVRVGLIRERDTCVGHVNQMRDKTWYCVLRAKTITKVVPYIFVLCELLENALEAFFVNT